MFVSPEIPELADHGITLPPNMQGLTAEQIVELKLTDEWEDKCVPSGGAVFRKDEIGRRNGHGETITQRKITLNACLTLSGKQVLCMWFLALNCKR